MPCGPSCRASASQRLLWAAFAGANAVVREDVPDYSVAVGVPARVIRTFA